MLTTAGETFLTASIVVFSSVVFIVAKLYDKRKIMLRQRLKQNLAEVIRKNFKTPMEKVKFEVFYPTHGDFGDYSTNIAFVLAKHLNEDREKIASQVIGALKKKLGKEFEKIEYANNGFLNFYFSKDYLVKTVNRLLSEKEKIGKLKIGKGQKINLEFTSANPTGPLPLHNARGAAYGNALANILDAAGYKVTREYYINDAGTQVELLGESVARRYLQLKGQNIDFAENLYQGEYIVEIAKEMDKELKRELGLFEDDFVKLTMLTRNFALDKILKMIKESLARLGVRFDVWFSEKSLHDSGEVKKVFDFLKFGDLAYEKDGAWWLKGKNFGLAEDPVLIRSSNQPTYLMGDIAYTKNKFGRGFDKIINIWGADHHGDVPRLRAGAKALNFDKDKIAILIHQFISTKKGGELIRMSKRAGELIILDELMQEVSPDAIKYFFISKSLDTHIEFDIDLAKEESEKNPVFYIQYALARISSILKKAPSTNSGQARRGILSKIFRPRPLSAKYDYNINELSLMRELVVFPEIIEDAAESYQVHLLANYAYELANTFNQFYESSRILGKPQEVQNARLDLAMAAWQVLKTSLGLMGLSQPEKM